MVIFEKEANILSTKKKWKDRKNNNNKNLQEAETNKSCTRGLVLFSKEGKSQ